MLSFPLVGLVVRRGRQSARNHPQTEAASAPAPGTPCLSPFRPAPPAPRALPEEVRRLAEGGQQLRAVERLRELSGVGLDEAMRLVEEHLGMRPWWQDLADTPGQKVAAIQAYRAQHGADLAEATRAVEEYLRRRGSRA